MFEALSNITVFLCGHFLQHSFWATLWGQKIRPTLQKLPIRRGVYSPPMGASPDPGSLDNFWSGPARQGNGLCGQPETGKQLAGSMEDITKKIQNCKTNDKEL